MLFRSEGPQCCSQAELTAVTREEAGRPSSILQPKARDKKEAQYFFSSSTSSFLASTVTKLGFTDVLCVGCPSVMELLPDNLNTLLLDLDPRFQSFYPPDKFVWYNFFNGHCFNGEQPKTVLQNFLIGAEKLLSTAPEAPKATFGTGVRGSYDVNANPGPGAYA